MNGRYFDDINIGNGVAVHGQHIFRPHSCTHVQIHINIVHYYLL